MGSGPPAAWENRWPAASRFYLCHKLHLASSHSVWRWSMVMCYDSRLGLGKVQNGKKKWQMKNKWMKKWTMNLLFVHGYLSYCWGISCVDLPVLARSRFCPAGTWAAGRLVTTLFCPCWRLVRPRPRLRTCGAIRDSGVKNKTRWRRWLWWWRRWWWRWRWWWWWRCRWRYWWLCWRRWLDNDYHDMLMMPTTIMMTTTTMMMTILLHIRSDVLSRPTPPYSQQEGTRRRCSSCSSSRFFSASRWRPSCRLWPGPRAAGWPPWPKSWGESPPAPAPRCPFPAAPLHCREEWIHSYLVPLCDHPLSMRINPGFWGRAYSP